MSNLKVELALSQVTEDDIEELGPLFALSFHDHEFFRAFQPDTPDAQQAWRTVTRHALKDPYTIALKVTDVVSGRIVSHGRWIRPRKLEDEHQPGEEEGRWDALVETCNEELANAFFGSFERNRKALMGERPHYYMEFLGTIEEYKAMGAGSLILKHGCDLADAEQIPCYVDASPRGKRVYEKFGFVFTIQEDLPLGFHYNYGVRLPQRR